MEKTYTVTLTGSEMVTLRAALNVYNTDRRKQAAFALEEKDHRAAVYFDTQHARAKLLYDKVFYQHEDQCEPA